MAICKLLFVLHNFVSINQRTLRVVYLYIRKKLEGICGLSPYVKTLLSGQVCRNTSVCLRVSNLI